MVCITRFFFFFLILYTCIIKAQTNKIFSEQSFGKGTTVFYMGSGAASRHIDWIKFKQETINYKRSPFVSLGFDHCVMPRASNAYWGLGIYISSWIANRQYVDGSNNNKENIWSNSLIAIRASHHNSFYVRKKLDMCSGLLLGTRIKYYHQKTINEKDVTDISDRTTFLPAFGITATLRYYFYKDFGVYVEGCLGYQTDFGSIGLSYKINNTKKKKN